jgi:hypothetical protein
MQTRHHHQGLRLACTRGAKQYQALGIAFESYRKLEGRFFLPKATV